MHIYKKNNNLGKKKKNTQLFKKFYFDLSTCAVLKKCWGKKIAAKTFFNLENEILFTTFSFKKGKFNIN